MRLKLKVTFAAIGLCLLAQHMVNAQEVSVAKDSLKATEQIDEPDTLVSAIQKLQSDILSLHNLKISGYVQAQYQIADTAGINSFDGGNFGLNIDNRFQIRRARLKFVYSANPYAKYQLQVDFRETGVTVRDAFAQFTAPFADALSLTAGMFDRPFGYAISYSSNLREAPERARIFQTLFPNERDLGAKMTIQGSKTSTWNFLKIDFGFFSGNNINPETDSKKDFIGHIGINKANKNESFKYGFGVSYYNGGVLQTNDNILSVDKSSNVPVFVAKAIPVVGAYKNKYASREYVGGDAEFTISSPVGFTTFNGEYLTGNQPGFSSATNAGNVSPSGPITVGDTYNRKFNGGYVSLVQDFSKAPISLVARYDLYDPNKNVNGNDIKAANKFSGADIKYTTVGFGLLYKFDANVKLTGYYDLVKNETSANLPGFTKDLKDNVITLRLQYKF
ncbi:MAG: hypothetical protein JWN56_28 [Sphingobacteriales bacterium]|nr:hypothetical protein [Sphingobacteriales bacterium]